MDDDRRRQLEQDHGAAAWRGRSAYLTSTPLRGLAITGDEISGWRPQRTDRKPGPPPHTTSFWGRGVGQSEEVLRLDVFELPTVNAAHDHVIALLNEFEATKMRRQEPPQAGDVAFGTELVLLFARANVVVLVRNAGRAIVEVASPAREFDSYLVGRLTGRESRP